MILGIAHSHLRYDQVYVGGVKITEDQGGNDNTRTTTTFVVPNGATYKIIYNDSILWAELR